MVALERTGITSRCGTVTGLVNSFHAASTQSKMRRFGDSYSLSFSLTFVPLLPYRCSFVTAFSGSTTKGAMQSRGAAGGRPFGTYPSTLRSSTSGSSVLLRTAAWESQGNVLGSWYSSMDMARRRQELVCDELRTSTSGGSVQAWGASLIVGSRDLDKTREEDLQCGHREVACVQPDMPPPTEHVTQYCGQTASWE